MIGRIKGRSMFERDRAKAAARDDPDPKAGWPANWRDMATTRAERIENDRRARQG
jgi:hypothetical protein